MSEALRLGVKDCQRFAIFFRGPLVSRERYFRLASQNGYGSTEFVRSVRHEAPLTLERRIDTLQQLIEGGGEMPEFVVLVVNGQALMQVGGADPTGAIAHGDDWSEAFSGENVPACAGKDNGEGHHPEERSTHLVQHFLLCAKGAENYERKSLALY